MKNRWEMNQEAFRLLLELLGDEPEEAGRVYGKYLGKLIRFFDWSGCEQPEMLADEVVNRVARRLEEGLEIRAADPYSYFYRVAQLVRLEHFRERERRGEALAEQIYIVSLPPEDEAADDRLPCLRRCLEKLAPEDSRLILVYEQGEKSARIRNRRRMAKARGMTLNALRIKSHRIRVKLERCVLRCLESEGLEGQAK